jgi:hypothetical protein
MAWKGRIEDYPDQKSRLAAIREGGKPFCEPYRSITSWMPDDAQITVSATNYWVTTPWDNRDGRVTLMGDAAHPMTPSEFSFLSFPLFTTPLYTYYTFTNYHCPLSQSAARV